MNKTRAIRIAAVSGLLAAWISILIVARAGAHCDTLGGPIVPEAKAALEKGDVAPVLKWVKKEHEAEIKAAFEKTVAVRAKGDDAKELADQYFLETLIRVHRAGEGAPYTGLKDEPVEPIVSMADNALAASSADEMIKAISGHMEKAILEKFNKALAARKTRDNSVEDGREYVEAYVTYMHYVEGIHAAITAKVAHAHDSAAPAPDTHAEHKEHVD